jgi:hypothetical protein
MMASICDVPLAPRELALRAAWQLAATAMKPGRSTHAPEIREATKRR